MENPIEEFKKKCFTVDHLLKQRQNTFKPEEKSLYDEQIKLLYREIDVILDEHNLRSKTMKNHFEQNFNQ